MSEVAGIPGVNIELCGGLVTMQRESLNGRKGVQFPHSLRIVQISRSKDLEDCQSIRIASSST